MIKLSVNETKWSSLLARTSALTLYISIWIFDFGPVKLPGLWRNGPLGQNYWNLWLACKPKQLYGPVNYRDFRETSPRSENRCGNWHFLIWNRVRAWRTGCIPPSKNLRGVPRPEYIVSCKSRFLAPSWLFCNQGAADAKNWKKGKVLTLYQTYSSRLIAKGLGILRPFATKLQTSFPVNPSYGFPPAKL